MIVFREERRVVLGSSNIRERRTTLEPATGTGTEEKIRGGVPGPGVGAGEEAPGGGEEAPGGAEEELHRESAGRHHQGARLQRARLARLRPLTLPFF